MPSASAAPRLSVANSSCILSVYLLVDLLSSELGPSYCVYVLPSIAVSVFCDVPIDSTLFNASNQFIFVHFCLPLPLLVWLLFWLLSGRSGLEWRWVRNGHAI